MVSSCTQFLTRFLEVKGSYRWVKYYRNYGVSKKDTAFSEKVHLVTVVTPAGTKASGTTPK